MCESQKCVSAVSELNKGSSLHLSVEEVHRGHPAEPDQPQHLRLPGQDLPADPQEEVPDHGRVL